MKLEEGLNRASFQSWKGGLVFVPAGAGDKAPACPLLEPDRRLGLGPHLERNGRLAPGPFSEWQTRCGLGPFLELERRRGPGPS